MDPLRRKDWTVLVYQGAVNNLEPDLQTNLQELAHGPHPDNVDVVVRQIDRQGTMRDYQVDARGLSPLGPPVTDVDSAATATLADFLGAGIARYPARHYLVMVSSHGRGAEGLIEDERKGTLISPVEFRNALEAGRESNHGRPIDMVFFDACRMMSLEMACEIRGSAEVAVGSMDRIGSVGYDPTVLIRETAQSADAEALSRRLVDNREDRQMDDFGSISAVALEATRDCRGDAARFQPGRIRPAGVAARPGAFQVTTPHSPP